MQILHLAHHHQYHIIKLKIILIILICLLCTGCSQDKVNINKIDIKSVEITDVIEIEYINNTDICLNYEYYFKMEFYQFTLWKLIRKTLMRI